MTRSYKSGQRKGFLFSSLADELDCRREISKHAKASTKESTTLEPPHRTNAKGRHQFFGRVFTGRTVGWTGGLGDVSKLRCWQYCIGKVFVTIRSDIRMQRMETCLNTEREGGPVDWHPQCPGKTGILLLALQRNTRALQFDSRPQKKH